MSDAFKLRQRLKFQDVTFNEPQPRSVSKRWVVAPKDLGIATEHDNLEIASTDPPRCMPVPQQCLAEEASTTGQKNADCDRH
jgi:hypothetical protein